MPKSFLLAMAFLAAGASTAAAQCEDRVGQGTGQTRDAALRAAYEAALKTPDERLLKAWIAAGQKVGEAPGHTVRKLTSNCSAGGAGQICRIAVTLCRN
jgi:hypothetical protein